MKYDAIIAGASFAGLAVARVLRGNILLVDKKPEIGTGQTSACCTFEHLLKKLGCEESALHLIDESILHIDSKNIVFHASRPFATIDYKKCWRYFLMTSG